MMIHSFSNGDELVQRDQALIARFAGRRTVLSTSALGGGLQRDLKWAFNHDCKIDGRKNTPLKAPTYAGHMAVIARQLGLDPAYACGLSTAADMENAAIETASYESLTVTAVVTGGIDVNGGRAGDPADWHERDGISVPTGGTINILLFVSANLTDGALTRALVTCTEAKTAALQELLAPSLYSSGIATGSGTDGTVIVCDPSSPHRLTYAGKHAKLGELIGRTVMAAVKNALFLQTGLGPEQQCDIFARAGRFGITREKLLTEHAGIDIFKLNDLSTQAGLVSLTSLYVHLLDQLNWGLLSATDAADAADTLLADMGMPGIMSAPDNADTDMRSRMIDAYIHGFAGLLT